MVRLVDDLLDVSRVTAGKIELRKDLVDVATIIQQAVQTSQPQFQEKNHALDLALPREPLELLVDPARLAQIVSNLLSNAAKYTDVGGAISLRAVSIGEFVEIRVKDNGRGSARRCCRRSSACSCSPTARSTWPRAGSASASRWSSAWSSSTGARSRRAARARGPAASSSSACPRRAASSPVRAAGRRPRRGRRWLRPRCRLQRRRPPFRHRPRPRRSSSRGA
jgi:hypothetical protein